MKADWQQQVDTDGGNIGDLLTSDPPLHKESWHQMKGWYKVVNGRRSRLIGLTIVQIIAEQVALHHHIPPPWEKIPISVDTFPWMTQ